MGKEQEEYEKKVGYLVKLGQDTEELDGGTAWWKKAAGTRLLEPTPSQLKATATGSLAAVRAKQTEFLDPLNSVRKYLGCEGVRLTMKSHQKMMEEKERKALDFGDVKDIKKVEKKHKRKERKRSRSRSRGKKRKAKRKGGEGAAVVVTVTVAVIVTRLKKKQLRRNRGIAVNSTLTWRSRTNLTPKENIGWNEIKILQTLLKKKKKKKKKK